MVKASAALAIVTVGSLLIAAGCGSGENGRASGEIVFTPANVSVTVGDGWLQVERKSDPMISSPALIRKTGMIHALALQQEFPSLKAAAEHLHKTFEANPKAVKDTFREENFTSDSGLSGIHLTYAARSADDPQGPPQSRSHNFVVQNREGKCVSINFIGEEGKDADGAEMIRKTLKAK